jgi:aspartate aminotransferase-like enzyme
MISVSDKAWQASNKSKMPSFYWDFQKAKAYLEKGQTPWTPVLSVIFALDIALDILLNEGLDNIFNRQAKIGQMTRKGIKSLGLTLFADENHASDTVTAVNVPQEVDGKQLVKVLREEKEIILGGGQQSMAGKIFRIGHLGLVSESEIEAVIKALGEYLPKLGFKD